VQHVSKDITSLEIINPSSRNKIGIVNVYNKAGTSAISDLGEAITKLDSHEELLVLYLETLTYTTLSGQHHIAMRAIEYQVVSGGPRAIRLPWSSC